MRFNTFKYRIMYLYYLVRKFTCNSRRNSNHYNPIRTCTCIYNSCVVFSRFRSFVIHYSGWLMWCYTVPQRNFKTVLNQEKMRGKGYINIPTPSWRRDWSIFHIKCESSRKIETSRQKKKKKKEKKGKEERNKQINKEY